MEDDESDQHMEYQSPSSLEAGHANRRGDKNYAVSDQELGILSGNVQHTNMSRIAQEFLNIPRRRIAELSQDDSWMFTYNCFDIWRKSCPKENKKACLYSALLPASEKGLIPKDVIYFLNNRPDSTEEAVRDSRSTQFAPLIEIHPLNPSTETTILDHEMSRLAYNLPPGQIFRISIEFLLLKQIQVEHAKTTAGNDAWQFAENCLMIWSTVYWGGDMRKKLYNSLMKVSKAGFLSQDVFSFLAEDYQATTSITDQTHSGFQRELVQRTNSKLLKPLPSRRPQNDPAVLMAFNQLAGLFSQNNMEQAAIHIFDYPESDFHFQRRQLMAHVLCSWWVNQQGSTEEKKSVLLDKLHSLETSNMAPTTQLQNIAMQLELNPLAFKIPSTKIELVTTISMTESVSKKSNSLKQTIFADEHKHAEVDRVVQAMEDVIDRPERSETEVGAPPGEDEGAVEIIHSQNNFEMGSCDDTSGAYSDECTTEVRDTTEVEVLNTLTITSTITLNDDYDDYDDDDVYDYFDYFNYFKYNYYEGPMFDAAILGCFGEYCGCRIEILLHKKGLIRIQRERGLRFLFPQTFIDYRSISEASLTATRISRKWVLVIGNYMTNCPIIDAVRPIFCPYQEHGHGFNLILPDVDIDSLPRLARYMIHRYQNVKMSHWNDKQAFRTLADAIQGKKCVSDTNYKPRLFKNIVFDETMETCLLGAGGKQRDAFMSYDMDCDFCPSGWFPQMVKHIEDNYDLTLVVAARDFMPGHLIIDSILDAFQEAKTFVHTVCDGSLTSHWCNEELNIALIKELELKRESIIHLVFPGTDFSKASQMVKNSMKRHTCIYMKHYHDTRTLDRLACAIRGEKPKLSYRIVSFVFDAKCKLFGSQPPNNGFTSTFESEFGKKLYLFY